MSRHVVEEEQWDDDEPEDEGDEDETTIPCPYCRRQIHEDSQRCLYCEQYLSEEDAPPSLKPWWIIVGALVCLLIVIMWIL